MGAGCRGRGCVVAGAGLAESAISSSSSASELPKIIRAFDLEGSSDHLQLTANVAGPHLARARAIALALRQAAARQAKVVGTNLGLFSSLDYGKGPAVWVIAIDRPGLHMPPSFGPVP